MVAMAGMDAWAWFVNDEPLEAAAMLAIARRRNELAGEEREDLANRTANAVGTRIFG